MRETEKEWKKERKKEGEKRGKKADEGKLVGTDMNGQGRKEGSRHSTPWGGRDEDEESTAFVAVFEAREVEHEEHVEHHTYAPEVSGIAVADARPGFEVLNLWSHVV